MDRVPITKQGLEKVKKELTQIEKVDRPENIRAIEEARRHGDLSENAEYHAAKERQGFLEGKIIELRNVVAKAEVIEIEEGPSDHVIFGKTVKLYDVNEDKEIAYQLLGPYESEPEKGIISVTSPLGQALVGKEVDDEVKVNTPGGVQEFEVEFWIRPRRAY